MDAPVSDISLSGCVCPNPVAIGDYSGAASLADGLEPDNSPHGSLFVQSDM